MVRFFSFFFLFIQSLFVDWTDVPNLIDRSARLWLLNYHCYIDEPTWFDYLLRVSRMVTNQKSSLCCNAKARRKKVKRRNYSWHTTTDIIAVRGSSPDTPISTSVTRWKYTQRQQQAVPEFWCVTTRIRFFCVSDYKHRISHGILSRDELVYTHIKYCMNRKKRKEANHI